MNWVALTAAIREVREATGTGKDMAGKRISNDRRIEMDTMHNTKVPVSPVVQFNNPRCGWENLASLVLMMQCSATGLR